MKEFFRQVREIYRPFQLLMLGALGFIAVSQALNAVLPYFNKRIVDGLVNHEPAQQVIWYAAAMLGLMVFRSTVWRWLREQYEVRKIDFAIPERTQNVTLQRMFGFSIGQHTNENSGVKQNIASRGENGLKTLVDMILFQTLPLILEIVIMTGMLLWWSPSLGMITGLCVVIQLTCVWYLNHAFRPHFKKMEKNYIEDSRFKKEVVDNIGLVIAQGQEDRAMKECDESLVKANAFTGKLWSKFITWASLRDALPAFGRFIVITSGIYGVAGGKYTVGELFMFQAWATSVLGNLNEFSMLQRRFIQAHTSVKRYFDMLKIEPEVKIIENPVRPDKFRGEIEFKDVVFRYARRDAGRYMEDEDDEPKTSSNVEIGPALDRVSFTIRAGESVALVGESGAGKSTVIQALIRAQDPEKGQILVDGHDLRLLELKHYRHRVGIVDQQVGLFDHTIRYNLTYGLNGNRDDIGDRELHEVARMARIDRFWPKLEKGFDTVIGERGVKLSGGERQRVGIARALIKNPDILIFDEATSNLDSENEEYIQESIDQASRGRTTIIIAHRFSTIRKVDRVLVFQKGRLVGQGSHLELTHSCEAYQRLIRNQKI